MGWNHHLVTYSTKKQIIKMFSITLGESDPTYTYLVDFVSGIRRGFQFQVIISSIVHLYLQMYIVYQTSIYTYRSIPYICIKPPSSFPGCLLFFPICLRKKRWTSLVVMQQSLPAIGVRPGSMHCSFGGFLSPSRLGFPCWPCGTGWCFRCKWLPSLKLTASLPLKMDGWKIKFSVGKAYLQGLC